jgi:hypothetical protein
MPMEPKADPEPEHWICSSKPPVEANGWLTASMSIDNSATMRPAPAGTRAAAEARILAAYNTSTWVRQGGHPFAVFGLYSNTNVVDRPQWLVVVCDGPQPDVPAGGTPMGSPGTPPSPGPQQYGVQFVTFGATSVDEGGAEVTSRDSPASLAVRYVRVPWHLVGTPSASATVVRISYPAAEPCATFDHLAVDVSATTVDVRVWLRLLPGGPATCPGTGSHVAEVGFGSPGPPAPLGTRELRDAGDFPPNEIY